MTTLRTAAQQALEAWDTRAGIDTASRAFEALRAALVEPVLQTCNCRWDGEMQMQQCTLHEAHVDAIKEWAQRAKFAEKKLAALAEQRLTDMEQKMERSIESLKTALAEPTPLEDVVTRGSAWSKDGKRIDPMSVYAEPVQEPVAWMVYTEGGTSAYVTDNPNDLVGAYRALPLYTAPPQRKPLTEEEILSLFRTSGSPTAFARAIERAHGIT